MRKIGMLVYPGFQAICFVAFSAFEVANKRSGETLYDLQVLSEKGGLLQNSFGMDIATKAAHWGLYLLLFALPFTAIAGAWLEGHPLTLLAGVEIPPLIGRSHDAGARIATIHTWLGDAILWLAGFHALAALYHHIVLKDGVLASMLPRWFPMRQR